MNELTKWNSGSGYKGRLTALTGFSLDNPKVRVPVQNPVLDKVRAAHGQRAKGRDALLLADRNGRADQSRTRGLGFVAPLAGVFGLPREARAHDHHPPLEPDLPDVAPLDPVDEITSLVDTLLASDWALPAACVMGASILVMQAIGVVQRTRIVRAVRKLAPDTQPDLFPETLVAEEDQEMKSAALPSHWTVDAASRQGKVRNENQDAFLVRTFNDGTRVMLVFDGAGGIEGGQEAARTAAESAEQFLREYWEQHGCLDADALEGAIVNAREVAAQKDLSGVTTALLVMLQENHVHWATVGDGAVVAIWPDGMVGHLQVPHHTAGEPSNIINAYIGHGCDVPPRVGSLRVEPGTMVMAMTDGASDLFPFEDFALGRNEYSDIDGLAMALLSQLEHARNPDTEAYLHHDNMTLAMARLSVGENQ